MSWAEKFPSFIRSDSAARYRKALSAQQIGRLLFFAHYSPSKFNKFVHIGREITNLKFDQAIHPRFINKADLWRAECEFEDIYFFERTKIQVDKTPHLYGILKDMCWALGG